MNKHNSTTMDLNKDKLDSIQSIITTAALLFGAWVGWSKFITGRVFHHRIDPAIAATVTLKNGVPQLLVTAKVTNIGQSKIDLKHNGCYLVVKSSPSRSPLPVTETPEWFRQRTVDVFSGQKQLESGEVLEEQAMFTLPAGNYSAFRLELRFESKPNIWQANFKGKVWGINTIVTPDATPV